jgi:antitoxin component YwqK of YwqJK toxin-antitoxin module
MRFLFIGIAFFFLFPLHAQVGKQKNLSRYYTLEAIYDSATGIDIYEKLNFPMGGDSVRNNPKGYAAQGTWEDYYKDGAVLHTGYYVEGQLRSYKNFYPDGKVERDFRSLDYYRFQMTLYYPDGKVRSDIIYFQGQEESTHEFYPNGNPEIAEEYAKKCEYLMFRTFYYENGKTESDLQLTDKKKKRYSMKEYYENGKIQTEGSMQYYAEVDNFLKEGSWKVYDETGKLIAEQEYVRGQMTEEKKNN